MIARIWRGVTLESKAKNYFKYLTATGLKDARAIDGNRGVMVLKRTSEGHAEFVVVSLWDSLDAIREFAGEDIDVSRYYPDDTEYLLKMEPEVAHYEVLVES